MKGIKSLRKVLSGSLMILLVSALIYCGLTDPFCFATGTINAMKPVVVKDIGGMPMSGVNAPGWVDAVVLTANTAQAYTVPTGTQYLLMSGTSNFYVLYAGVATIPASLTTNGLSPELNPVLRKVPGGTVMSFISPAASVVTISVYK